MKVIVLGGGVIGVTTAYYLNRAGHAVTLIERNAEVAHETSFANGGQVSWSSASPWAAPGVVTKALGWLFKPHSPLVLRPRLDPVLWAWLLRMLGNCRAEPYVRNKLRQIRLARYSHGRLVALRAELGIQYDAETRGTLVLFRDARELEHVLRDRGLWAQFDIRYQVLTTDACVTREPALAAAQHKIAAGLLFPEDESGDCRKFTVALAQRCVDNGVRLLAQTHVQKLVGVRGAIERIVTDHGELQADAYVLACGSYTPLLLQPLGIRLPVYPVKGYSLTLPITDPERAPHGTLTDERYKVVVTRLGDRLRAAGTAELTGYDLRLRPSRCATIDYVVRDLFPGVGDFARAEYWTGLRPMTPDNPPVLGATPYANLYLNTGHGTLGWTMACGSAQVVADIVTGQTPATDLDGLTLARFT